MSVHRNCFKERQYFSMKPFNLLYKLSSNNVIVYKSKGSIQMPCVQFVRPLVSFVLLVQPCSNIKSVIGLVLMTQFVY